VTHELRTPLTSIRAFSEILRDDTDLEQSRRQRFLDIIVKESERLTRLINQVLDLAKLESGEIEWNLDQVNLNDVVEEATNTMSQVCQENSIKLVVFTPADSLFVMAVRDRLIQVVINLLSNAVKFCVPGEGAVVVRLTPQSGKARVEFKDNGSGIHPDEQLRVFDKFHQLKGVRDEKPGGSGLGLAICHSIIKHHGGNIWVESKPGAGAKFIFELDIRVSEK
jgi:signal transduction histidine kinase